jgi:hypothetical protein
MGARGWRFLVVVLGGSIGMVGRLGLCTEIISFVENGRSLMDLLGGIVSQDVRQHGISLRNSDQRRQIAHQQGWQHLSILSAQLQCRFL